MRERGKSGRRGICSSITQGCLLTWQLQDSFCWQRRGISQGSVWHAPLCPHTDVFRRLRLTVKAKTGSVSA